MLDLTPFRTWTHEMRREDWSVRTVTYTHLSGSKTDFHIRARMQAFEDDVPIRDETYTVTIPRDSV